MSKRITLNPYLMDERTMTPEQYLEKLKQEALDKEFDELARLNAEKQAQEELVKEEREKLANTIKQICDCEDELAIAEDIYSNMLMDTDTTKAQKEDMSKFIKNTKIKYSKLQHQLEKMQ